MVGGHKVSSRFTYISALHFHPAKLASMCRSQPALLGIYQRHMVDCRPVYFSAKSLGPSLLLPGGSRGCLLGPFFLTICLPVHLLIHISNQRSTGITDEKKAELVEKRRERKEKVRRTNAATQASAAQNAPSPAQLPLPTLPPLPPMLSFPPGKWEKKEVVRQFC